MSAYQEAAHELANHVSGAVRIQRGDVEAALRRPY